jgi:hypothetical protein
MNAILRRSDLATTALKAFLILALQYCVSVNETHAAGSDSANSQSAKMTPPPPSPTVPSPRLQSTTTSTQNPSAGDEREIQQHAKDTIRIMLDELNGKKL